MNVINEQGEISYSYGIKTKGNNFTVGPKIKIKGGK